MNITFEEKITSEEFSDEEIRIIFSEGKTGTILIDDGNRKMELAIADFKKITHLLRCYEEILILGEKLGEKLTLDLEITN